MLFPAHAFMFKKVKHFFFLYLDFMKISLKVTAQQQSSGSGFEISTQQLQEKREQNCTHFLSIIRKRKIKRSPVLACVRTHEIRENEKKVIHQGHKEVNVICALFFYCFARGSTRTKRDLEENQTEIMILLLLGLCFQENS